MERWVGKVAVVTGASSGIGLAIAKALFKEGMAVIGFARRKNVMEDAMKTVSGKGKFYARECDVASEQNVLEAFQWIKKNFQTVHILINNAGLATPGTIEDTTRQLWEKKFNTNVMGLLQCSQQAIKLMKETGVEGHIVNINSIQGHRVYKMADMFLNVYPATKFAVTAITEELQKENIGGKIKVTSISPGLVKTNIATVIEANKAGLKSLSAEDIANAVIYVISTPPNVQVTELTIRILGEDFRSD